MPTKYPIGYFGHRKRYRAIPAYLPTYLPGTLDGRQMVGWGCPHRACSASTPISFLTYIHPYIHTSIPTYLHLSTYIAAVQINERNTALRITPVPKIHNPPLSTCAALSYHEIRPVFLTCFCSHRSAAHSARLTLLLLLLLLRCCHRQSRFWRDPPCLVCGSRQHH